MFDLLINIFASIIWFLFGVTGLWMSKKIVIVMPLKKIWRIRSPKELVICIATSTKTDTGEYFRPATGVGQARSLAIVYASLSKAYKNIQVKNILLSIDPIQNQIEHDLILLGGPKNNDFSRILLKKIEQLKIVNQNESTIYWLHNNSQDSYIGTTNDKRVTTDYGLIIRMENPFVTHSAKPSIILLSGSHTYGTIAAAKYFTENLVKEHLLLSSTKKNLFIIVECDVFDGYPVGIKEIKRHESN